jgi:hypothetical protein
MRRFLWLWVVVVIFLTVWPPVVRSADTAEVTALTWDPPTTWVDGTPLVTGDLLGYKLYMRTSPTGSYPVGGTLISGGTTTVFNLSNLTTAPTGTNYFVLTSIGAVASYESAYSNEIYAYKLPSGKWQGTLVKPSPPGGCRLK